MRRANSDYWLAKIGRNVERDLERTRQLTELGWRVLRLWEMDILTDPEAAVARVQATLQDQRLMAPAAS